MLFGVPVDRDAEALEQVARGDVAALEALYDRHATTIYSLALRIVRDVAEAEDVAQEVFTQVWTQARRYDVTRGSVAAWMLVIARTRSLDRLRRRRAVLRPGPSDDVLAELPAPGPGADLLAATAQEAECARVAVASLPSAERDVLELAYYEGLTQSEIAERTGTPLGTVKTRVRSALQRIRQALTASGAAGGRQS
jgi:RNA polymerase sigma-70 factor (ECF subfamily)